MLDSGTHLYKEESRLKPQIYKVGENWIVWVPGARLYRFETWQQALDFVLEHRNKHTRAVAIRAAAAAAGG